MSEELLPCPFCGMKTDSRAKKHLVDTEISWVYCIGCEAEGPRAAPPISAGQWWNTRTPARLESLKQLQQESERLGLYYHEGARHMSKDWSEEYYKEPTQLELKQRERREFVKAYVLALMTQGRVVDGEDVSYAIALHKNIEKHLAEIEEKEQAE